MLSIERFWNAWRLGGMLSALLATAGVVNLGDLPRLPSFATSPSGPALAAQQPADTVTLALPERETRGGAVPGAAAAGDAHHA